MNHMTESNKQGWDRLAAVHSKTYHINKLLSGEPLPNELIRSRRARCGAPLSKQLYLADYI